MPKVQIMPPRRRPTTRLLTPAGWAGTIALATATAAALVLAVMFHFG